METVSINENTETNISLEEQSKQQDAAGINDNIELSDRPEWLPEKFNNAQDMAQAYAELESKVGQQPSEESEQVDPAEDSPQNEAISNASSEWAEKGELTDSSYDELAKTGISREMVDMYIAGQQSVNSQEEAELQSAVGGEDNYNAMAQWAQTSLSEQEISDYDEVVTGSSVGAAKMAVQGLYARFQSSGSASAPLLGGSVSGNSSEVFRSSAQVKEAMSDPRYQIDPAYRNQVAERLRHSNVM